jgi:uncharacterized protein (DUF2267 family)
MPATGLEVFDKTLQNTNIWLDEIMAELGPDRHVAWHTMGAVLHAVRDRLPPDDAAHLAAQLPILVRGLFYDQYRPSETPERIRTLDEFLERVTRELRGARPVNPRAAVRTVFGVLAHHITQGEVNKVKHALPEDIASLVQDVGGDGDGRGEDSDDTEERRAASERARSLRQLRSRVQSTGDRSKVVEATKPRANTDDGTGKPRRKTAEDRAAARDPGRGGERPDQRSSDERARPRDTRRQGS